MVQGTFPAYFNLKLLRNMCVFLRLGRKEGKASLFYEKRYLIHLGSLAHLGGEINLWGRTTGVSPKLFSPTAEPVAELSVSRSPRYSCASRVCAISRQRRRRSRSTRTPPPRRSVWPPYGVASQYPMPGVLSQPRGCEVNHSLRYGEKVAERLVFAHSRVLQPVALFDVADSLLDLPAGHVLPDHAPQALAGFGHVRVGQQQ